VVQKEWWKFSSKQRKFAGRGLTDRRYESWLTLPAAASAELESDEDGESLMVDFFLFLQKKGSCRIFFLARWGKVTIGKSR